MLVEGETVFIRESITMDDPPNAQQVKYRSRYGYTSPPKWVKDLKEPRKSDTRANKATVLTHLVTHLEACLTKHVQRSMSNTLPVLQVPHICCESNLHTQVPGSKITTSDCINDGFT